MFRLLSAAVAVALLGGYGFADDKKPVEDKPAEKKDEKKLSGVWMKEADGLTLIFDFTKKDELVMTVAAGENGLLITSKLTTDKDGRVKAKATKVETKGEFPVKLMDDYECSFNIVIDGKTAKISDFKASEHEEQGKGAVEGDYTKQEKKEK
jgi:hypothetical protein